MSRTTDTLSGLLVRRAARTAPGALSARWEEEWLADLHERASGPSRLAFAFGCFWASAAIGRECRTRLFKPMDPPPLSPRMIDVPPPKVMPPAPRIDWRLPTRSGCLGSRVRHGPGPTRRCRAFGARAPGTISLPREVIHVQGGTGPGFPHPDEYYPDVARRLEEQGMTTLKVCVDARGRLTADPVAAETSGGARLDAAAIRLAKAGSGHYRPSTDDGRPVSSCYPVRIRFQLRN